MQACNHATLCIFTKSSDFLWGVRIDHCLAKKVETHCKLQFPVQLLVAVIICNCAKSVLMFWTLWHQHDKTLVTPGDAIASWLDNPDDLTKGDCLMARSVPAATS